MSFSKRSSLALATNALTRALERARAAGRAVLDLTVSNPTRANLPYPEEEIRAALGRAESLIYQPEALGLPEARRAVSAHYADLGLTVPAERIALTASTSEAYAVLFKLLADPGDEILVPSPSYPLFGLLASFEAVALASYPLVYAGSWHVDLDALRARVGPRTRAIVVVAPNNPTGQYLSDHELEALLDLDVPIISDEVFSAYPLEAAPREGRITSVAGATRSLVFALSGLSKFAALPQMKLGWVAAAGDPARVREAMDGLELLLDAYLSVGAPVQHALPALLGATRAVRDAIRERARRNLRVLRQSIPKAAPLSVLDVEGGWYAIVRVPETCTDEAWAIDLLETRGVLVHPGYFFDMHRGAHLVLSLLTPERDFAEGVRRMVDHLLGPSPSA